METTTIHNDSDEAALIAALHAHEESALATLYAKYRSLLMGVIMKVIHDPAESEDVLQDVLLQVWSRIGAYDSRKGKLTSWLATVARRRAIDRVRQACAYRRATDRFEMERRHDPETSPTQPDDDAVSANVRELIDRELNLLPDLQRQAVSMAFLQGRSQREIAAFTNTPLGTVKTRIELGLKKLLHSLGGRRAHLLA